MNSSTERLRPEKMRIAHPAPARALGVVETTGAAAGVLGSGVLTATLLHGRTALFFPSITWLLTAAAIWALAVLCWYVDARLAPGNERLSSRRWQRAAWPRLALLLPAFAAASLYLDDTSHHVLANSDAAKQSLLTYCGVLYVAAEALYLVLAPRWRTLASAGPEVAGSIERATPLVLCIAAAAYVNACIITPWPPVHVDLNINLVGARQLIAGVSPYASDVEQWGDRVHLLPMTLFLLFGPLALLPERTAHAVFFIANQAMWLAGLGVMARWLAPKGQRLLWLAGLLVFSATYWPWQEAIRFGQQDGLILLLYAASIVAASHGRPWVSGVALGLSFPIKPVSVWLPLIYAVYGYWRPLFVGGALGIMLALATLPFTGIESWRYLLVVQLPEMLHGSVRTTNIPLAALHARFVVTREWLGLGGPAPSYTVLRALNLAATAAGLLLAAHIWLRTRRETGPSEQKWVLDASLALALTLLLAPYAWQHYASWLIFAFFVLALPATWSPLSGAPRVAVGVLGGLAFLLLNLEDGMLLRAMAPLAERWPSVLAFYPAGLLCITTALAVARFSPKSPSNNDAVGAIHDHTRR